MHVVADDLELGAFLPGFAVIPLVHLQTPFDEHRSSLAEVLAGNLRGTSPAGDVDKSRFFVSLIRVAIGPVAVDGQTEVGDRRSRRNVSQFRISREVTHQDYFVVIRHP